MPRTGGPKQRSWTKKRKGWPSKTRSYPWRKGSARPAEALKGMKVGVGRASNVHRFTRWAGTVILRSADVGGGVQQAISDVESGSTNPISVNNTTMEPLSGFGVQFGGAAQFTLADLPQYTEFTALYDHYAIEQVDVEMDCLANSAAASNDPAVPYGQNKMPTITYVPDFDDAVVPSSGQDVNQYQRAKTWTFRGDGKPLKFSIKPRTAVTVYRSAVTAAYAPGRESQQLDASYTDIPHYGFKFWVNNMPEAVGGLSTPAPIRVKMRYHLKFLDPR